jgi:hypothetical protein
LAQNYERKSKYENFIDEDYEDEGRVYRVMCREGIIEE